MSDQERRRAILKQIDELKVQINNLGTEIERERNESSEEDSAIRQELLDKKEILEQKIVELKNSLIALNNDENQLDGHEKSYKIEISGITRVLEIVLPNEADPSQGKISVDSPLAKALLGRKKGETVEVQTPAGTQNYKITSVS